MAANTQADLAFESATIAALAAVLRLLSDNGLPVADVEVQIDAFTLVKSEGTVVGTVGLETYAKLALLRSLCVAPSHRSRGIGAALVRTIESRAALEGVRELYLLTTGAKEYFANLGFVSVPRDQVPHEIRSTAQFSSLCPSTAVCMCKAVAGSLELDSSGRHAVNPGFGKRQ